MHTQNAIRPELAELPRPVAFPAIESFSELFPELTLEKQEHPFQGSAVTNWIQIRDRGAYRHKRAVLPQWLIDWCQENMLPVNYDSIYFTVTIRDDGALICAQYNQIIGSRWLALVDADTVPE